MNEDQLVELLAKLMAKPKVKTYPTYQEIILAGGSKAKLPIINSSVTLQQTGQFNG